MINFWRGELWVSQTSWVSVYTQLKLFSFLQREQMLVATMYIRKHAADIDGNVYFHRWPLEASCAAFISKYLSSSHIMQHCN